MKTSRAAGSSKVGRSAGSTARWIDVGRAMDILLDKWVTMRGSRPSPEKVDASRGALLGFAFAVKDARARGCSNLGFEVKSEDIIWLGGREAGAAARSWSCSSTARGVFRGRFNGLASAVLIVLSSLLGAAESGRVLRFATRLAFSLQSMRDQLVYARGPRTCLSNDLLF